MMFVFLLLLSSSFASQLISTDQIDDLFKKFMKNELSEVDNALFQELLEIVHRPERASKEIDYSSESRIVLSKVRRYFTAGQLLNLYQAQVRSCMEYCSHLWDGSAKYQLLALDSIEKRAKRLIADNALTIDCIFCRSVFSAGIESVNEGQTVEQLSEVITTLCSVIGIVSYNVCRGAVGLNMPIIHHIIRTTPEVTPGAFCGLLLQNAHNKNVCPFNDNRFEWTVDLPPLPAFTPVPIADDKPLTVAVMTDFHIDPLYEANGVGDCDEPTCCRKGQRPSTSYRYQFDVDEQILARSIVNISGTYNLDLDEVTNLRKMRSLARTRYPVSRNSPPAGYWGDYRDCDTPIWAFDDAIERIAETHKDIDVVYYIGDTIDHFVWETTYELINNVNRYAIEKMRKSFGENVLIIPAIGNHESQPTNQFAPNSVTGPKINTTWLYEALAEKWSGCLPEDAHNSFKERGEFSVLVRPGLRVIVINNNVAYKYNWWLVYDPQDAKTHLDWLIEELRKAELAGEHVHILAHIPPGVHDLTYTWTREYNRIVNRFSSIIKAEFNGHTHSDEFKIMYNPEGSPVHVAWGAGSATSYTYYNLNYKIATFDGVTYAPTNLVNYVYNLTEANLTPNRRPHWFQLYDMKNTFQLTDLSPESLNDLVYRMVTTDRNLLDMYSAFFSKLSDSRMSWCHDECKLDNVCKIVVSVLWERQKCEELRQIFYSRT